MSAPQVFNCKIFDPPIQTRGGLIVALFSVTRERITINQVRLRVSFDDMYEIAFAREGMVSNIVIGLQKDRDAI